ncbi:hypothetical protein TDB9533_04796 [Thalassocella blandensis]|nr:hypothetical protein TDB9533_04796 [Thalassocella blandensis]
MERVYVESDWYDGPRSGIADFNGIPHRFISNFDDATGYIETFNLFPILSEELELEIEQWIIFVEWNKKYEAGQTDTKTHPGRGGLSQRWDEIEDELKLQRETIPEDSFLAKATFPHNGQEGRYELAGPCYGVVWKNIEKNA